MQLSEKMPRISICIATYNGQQFIKEQMDSILPQLKPRDEIIVLDDCSTDHTLEIINNYSDQRIKCHRNEKNIGACATFEKLIGFADGEIIVLSDQDDIWLSGRLEKLRSCLLTDKTAVVASNFSLIDKSGAPLNEIILKPLRAADSNRPLRNMFHLFLGNALYFGSAMAFKSTLKDLLLPFPNCVEAHDHYIAIAGNLLGKCCHLEDETLLRRIHDSNLSSRSRSIFNKIKTRMIFLCQIWMLLVRRKKAANKESFEARSHL